MDRAIAAWLESLRKVQAVPNRAIFKSAAQICALYRRSDAFLTFFPKQSSLLSLSTSGEFLIWGRITSQKRELGISRGD